MTIEEMVKMKKENNKNYTFYKWNNFNEIISMLLELRQEITKNNKIQQKCETL